MAFLVPLLSVENSQQAIAVLKKKGVRAYGLAGDAKTPIGSERFSPPALFLFGNEGEGLSPGVRILCDEMLSIPMNPRCESLNVAASAAVAMYAWSSKHPRALN